MLIRNLTNADVVLGFAGREYVFPAAPVAEESGKPMPIPVVRIGTAAVASHFIARTYESPSRRDGRPTGSYLLAEYVPPKGAKEGTDYVVAGDWLGESLREPERVVSIHTWPAGQRVAQPEPTQEKLELVRKERIALMDMSSLTVEALKRGLIGKKDRPNKEAIVDKLFASGYVAANRF
jgi:hypothetical protein